MVYFFVVFVFSTSIATTITAWGEEEVKLYRNRAMLMTVGVVEYHHVLSWDRRVGASRASSSRSWWELDCKLAGVADDWAEGHLLER